MIRPRLAGRLVHALVLAALAVACTTSDQPPSSVLPSLPALPLPFPTSAAARAVSVRVVGPEGGVSGASVCATRTGGASMCSASGADGRAVLELVRGTYAVRATPAKGARLGEGVATVDLGEGTNAVVTLDGLAHISGHVTVDRGGDVAGAEVCAHSTTDDATPCARTRADGTYIVDVRPGVHKVEVSGPPDGSHLLTQWARGRLSSDESDVVDTRAADVTGLDVVLRRGVVLSGTVTARRDGSPVKEAQVCTYPLSAPLGWDCDKTDKRGHYAVVREPDTYWIWVIPPGDRGSRLVYQRYDRVEEGVDASPFPLRADATLDVALTEGTVVRGRVTGEGTPVVLGLVCIDTPFPSGRICRPTADDGSYEIATRPETYVVNVQPPAGSDVIAGFWPNAARDWTVAGRVRVGSSDARLDITLPRGVRLSGSVRDARGAPVESATVNVNDASGPRWFGATDMHGHYSIAVPPGSYTVDVFPPRIAAMSVVGQRVDVGGDTGYDVALPDPGVD